MRTLGFCLIAASLGLNGCNWLKSSKNTEPVAPPIKNPGFGPPTAQDLVNYLNNRADQLGVIESSDIDLVASVQGKRQPGLVGVLVCEKPRNFRLNGNAMGTQWVDIGSNGKEFWFWVKDGESPLYHCSYSDYEQKAVRLPLPFQPEWVVQALGMARYDPAKQYTMESKKGTYELVENTTLQGIPVRKITVFYAGQVSGSQPQVTGHIIQNASTGKIICQATIKRVYNASYRAADRNVTVPYPSEVLLEWPSEQLSITMKIGKATINQKLTNEEEGRYFSLPNWPGIKTIDLARMPPPGNPTSRDVRQAGAYR